MSVSSIRVKTLNITCLGFIILSIDVVKNFKPTNIIITDIASAVIYSALACPNGCSLSAGLSDIANPTIVINEEPTSVILLTASATTAILPAYIPIIIFNTESIVLLIIPTIPQRYPYDFITFLSEVLS